MNPINGVPQPRKHRKLGGKKVATGGAGGAAGGCGTHNALIVDPAALSPLDGLIAAVAAAGLLAGVTIAVLLVWAWLDRGERR